MTTLRLTLIDAKEWTGSLDGKTYRREEWSIAGGEICPVWRHDAETRQQARDRAAQSLGYPPAVDWEPSSHFTLYVVDGKIDPRLAGYGGSVWPTAWTELFMVGRYGHDGDKYGGGGIQITDQGLALRAAALPGAA